MKINFAIVPALNSDFFVFFVHAYAASTNSTNSRIPKLVHVSEVSACNPVFSGNYNCNAETNPGTNDCQQIATACDTIILEQFCGDVVLNSVYIAFRDEEHITDQHLKSKFAGNIILKIVHFKVIEQ